MVESRDSIDNLSFKTKEAERLRKQALFTWEEDKRLLSNILPAYGNCLDLGCGPGLYSFLIKELSPQLKITAVDCDGKMLSDAKEAAQKLGENSIDFVQGNAQKLNFSDSTFDFIFSRLLFQHLSNPKEGLKESNRVLKTGGQIVICETDGTFKVEPSLSELDEMYQIYEEWIKKEKGGDRKIGQKVGQMLEKAGFSNIENKKIYFDFNKDEFDAVVLNIFPPIKEKMILSGIIAEKGFEKNMKRLTEFAQNKLKSLSLPLYYWSAVK